MKHWYTAGRLLLVFAIITLSGGCFKDHITKVYTIMTPVFASKASVLANVKSNTPQVVSSPGKIFVLGRYLFINEIDKGVHVFDNSDPSNPKNVTFINIPGNIDIAVKGTMLYADMYKDLLAIDIADPLHARLVKTVPEIFPDRNFGPTFNDSAYIIVGWNVKDTTVSVDLDPVYWEDRRVLAYAASYNSNSKGNFVPGIAGSMARFSVVQNYLYTINLSTLHAFDINNPGDPQLRGSTTIGWNIETLYPFGSKLFVGSTTGMFIYNISDPANPVQEGAFSHILACDPVVTDGDFAYVTLRSGTTCGRAANQLDVLDISNVQSPSLVRSYVMTNPGGLAKDENALFICDGVKGLRVFDAKDPRNIRQLQLIAGMETYDAIAWAKNLIVVAKEGIFQYDYTNLSSLKQLSVIAAERK